MHNETRVDSCLNDLVGDRFVVCFTTLVVTLLLSRILAKPVINLPELNPKKPFEFTNRRRLAEFFQHSKEILIQGRERFRNKLYKAYCDWGEVIVVSPEHIEELRSDSRLSFMVPANDVSLSQ